MGVHEEAKETKTRTPRRWHQPLVTEDLAGLAIPGAIVSIDPETAESMGAFLEDALSEEEAWESNDELLGLHIIGAKATELVHEGLIALKLESTSEEIAHAIHAHPTLGEGLGEAAHAVLGKATGI